MFTPVGMVTSVDVGGGCYSIASYLMGDYAIVVIVMLALALPQLP